MTERIDAFAHALPEEFATKLAEYDRNQFGDLTEATRMWDIERRLNDMDTFGVDRQCIMLANSTIWRGMDPDEALPLVELANDAMADLSDQSNRLIPVATIPFATDNFIAEFERCVQDLGMAGAQIFSNVDGRPIDGPEFQSLYAAAEAIAAPLWLHPQLYEWYGWADEYCNDKIFGWLFDTSLALSRLVFSGVMQDYPDLQIIPHHMGGMIPFFHRRIQTFKDAYAHLDYADLDEPAEEYFRRFYPDTGVNGSVPALRCGLEFFGSDQVVFGTDYPFGPEEGQVWMRDAVQSMEELDVSESDKEQIYQENIESLMA